MARAASQWSDLFEDIKARGTVRIGIGYQTAPMNFLDDQGELAGFDVDLAKAVADNVYVSAADTVWVRAVTAQLTGAQAPKNTHQGYPQ